MPAGAKAAFTGSRLSVAPPLGSSNPSPKNLQVLADRNKLLREWAAASHGGAISYVDFDAMSRDAHRPTRAAKDVHWMCWLQWPRIGSRVSLC